MIPVGPANELVRDRFDVLTILPLIVASGLLIFALVLAYLARITAYEADPHETMLRACLHASTSAPVGSDQYRLAYLACDAKVSMRGAK